MIKVKTLIAIKTFMETYSLVCPARETFTFEFDHTRGSSDDFTCGICHALIRVILDSEKYNRGEGVQLNVRAICMHDDKVTIGILGRRKGTGFKAVAELAPGPYQPTRPELPE